MSARDAVPSFRTFIASRLWCVESFEGRPIWTPFAMALTFPFRGCRRRGRRSAIGANPENIRSLRGLRPLTRGGPLGAQCANASLGLVQCWSTKKRNEIDPIWKQTFAARFNCPMIVVERACRNISASSSNIVTLPLRKLNMALRYPAMLGQTQRSLACLCRKSNPNIVMV
jgi:hypothetical protein